jgi:hypothetical protein
VGAFAGGGPGLASNDEVNVFEPKTELAAQAGGAMSAAVHSNVSTPPPQKAFSIQRARVSRRILQPPP